MADGKRQLLRHTVATLAYRGGKVVRDVPESFGGYQAAPGVRTPLQILSHIGDLLDWAQTIANGQPAWADVVGSSWQGEVERFHRALSALDARLSSPEPLSAEAEGLFQGPIADALTHVGQIALLRRMAGIPVRGENYYMADIRIGTTGAMQPSPRREFE